ncbi:MAG: GTPase HflX [Hoeflea sp.]|nr:GTPase HflX [Alphaproteobacteria bacterium]MBV1723792.1 GTPase HflX [Hoeflea sp.]MBU4546582.1 GTPase HflX [Alphaproteobacteria bacterium]MBU4550850.1 GTPase HflX [Alphaproteobacteria bacterium]MBV1763069.1 GTPase HflX [Hoeflea sp.]
MGEAIGLAGAIDLQVAEALIVPVSDPRPSTLFGKGKMLEIKELIDSTGSQLVIVDHPLTPVQQRNLEEEWKVKVIDRTGLILEIFGRRASTKEGVLQVELAHLNYQKGRLVRSWTHLERQRGGGGFMGGPGETQIEADRRLLQERIIKLERELDQVRRTRQLHRAKRKKVPHPIVALVGYTNAGKSTLFNRVTGAEVLAEDMLFATLDPTLRRMKLPHGATVILSDTVGFISNLPTHLVAAFRATLEEVLEADLILHVRDMSDPDRNAQAADVEAILKSLGVGEDQPRKMLEVWNKVDLLEPDAAEALRARAATGESIVVSALTGEGVDTLLSAIEARISGELAIRTVVLDAQHLQVMSWIYDRGRVKDRIDHEDGSVEITAEFTAADSLDLDRQLGLGPKPDTDF